MIEIATAKINRFASEQADVPTEEESIFVQKALESPEDLRQIVQAQARQIEALNARLQCLEKDLDTLSENQLIQLRIINDLRKDKEPGQTSKDRADILSALLAANGGKMLIREARQKMHLSGVLFSQLLKTMKDDVETKPYHLNKSWKVLVLR